MRRLAVASAVTALLLSIPIVAHAASTRVVVAGPAGDPTVSRLQKELAAMGFEPVRVDDAGGCAGGPIAGWVKEMNTSAAACSDGSAASVWVLFRGGVRMADIVTPRADEEHAPDVVAVRAAEIVRASLELPGGESEPAAEPPPPEPPPTWSVEPAPPGSDKPVRPAATKRPRVAPRTPLVTMGLGASALLGADANAAALDTEISLRIHRYAALAARTALTFDGTTVSSPRHTVRVAPSLFGLGPVFPLLPSDSFVIPRVGGGVGLVWLRSAGTDQSDPFAAAPSVSTSSSVTSAAAYVNAAMSLRVGGPFRFTFEGLLGTTANRIVVRAEGEHIAYWGQPFGSFGMRAELMFR